MKIAFQMDSMDSLKFASDTTWQLMLEAAKISSIYHFTPQDLIWCEGKLFANLQEVVIQDASYRLQKAKIVDLTNMDIIFIRQDPPFDMAYLTTTYLLEKISDKVLILNDPKAIRDFPEKISVLDYPDLIPPTIITYNEQEARKFASRFNKVILKPLYSFAGNDVFCTKEADADFAKIMSELIKKYQAPIIIQRFIEGVIQGDKRIILVDGDPIGGFLRKPKKGDVRSNSACGGTVHKAAFTEREIVICKAIKHQLVENNLFLVGIDIIDGYLTEINVTSPTGIVAIKEFYNPSIAKGIIEAAIAKTTKINQKLQINFNKTQ